jgi:hypothetical protein
MYHYGVISIKFTVNSESCQSNDITLPVSMMICDVPIPRNIVLFSSSTCHPIKIPGNECDSKDPCTCLS